MTPFEQHLWSNESAFINPEKLSDSAFFDEMNTETLTRLQAEDEDTIIWTIEQCAEQDPNAREFLEQCRVRFSDNLATALKNAVQEETQERQSESLWVTVPDSLRDTLQSWELDLSVERALWDVESYIDTNLILPVDSNISQTEYEAIKSNIGKLIQSGLWDMETIIAEAQEENPDLTLRELTWIINSKISEKFDNIRAYVIPPVQMYLKYSSQSERENLNTHIGQEAERAYVSQRHPNPNAPANRTVDQMVTSRERQYTQDYEYFEREMRDMFINGTIQSVDELKNLDATLGVTQDEYRQIQADTRENLDVSLLNEADKQIESEAMCYFLFAVGVQCLPYVGWVTGAVVDGRDMFSNQDSTIEYLKQAGLIPAEFHIEKTTIDRLLAGAGIALSLVWLQALAKSKKLAKAIKWISRIPAEQIGRMLENFGGKVGLSDETMQSIRRLLWLEEGRRGDWMREVDRTNLEEDIPRENLRLREIDEFQELSPEQIWRVDELLQEVIQDMKYNSFEKIDKLFAHYFENINKTPWYTLQDAFKELDLSRVDFDEGSNCVGMSLELQRRLDEEWIDAKLIRFDAGGLINNDYVVNGHSALVIPYMKDGEESFVFADPWLMIRQNIAFTAWESSDEIEIAWKTYRILAEWTEDLPYTLQIWDKRLLFDPHNEWTNPAETLNKDIMRAIWDFKIVRQNPPWRPTVFRLDIEKEFVSLGTNEGKIDIPLETFQNLDKSSQQYRFFEDVMRDLWENPDELYERVSRMIEHLDAYRSQIWSPSTREIINNQ